MDNPNTPETYADLLKARGDIPIATLRQVKAIIDDLLAAVDTIDVAFDVKPAPDDASAAIAAALRAKYPEFADKSDSEVLAYFDVTVGGA